VRWVEASAAPRAALVTLPAEVVLPPHGQALASPPLTGQVVRWHVAPGDAVAVGQPLADMRSADLTTLRADEALYQDLTERSRKQLDDQRGFVRDGVQTRQSLYDAQAAYDAARAQLTAARQRLRAAQTLVTFAPDGVHWVWVAGSPGEVVALTCAVGAVIEPHTPCVTLIDASAARVRVHLPERHIGHVSPDLRAEWRPSALPEGAPPLTLRLSRQGPTLDPSSRTLPLDYTPDDPNLTRAVPFMRPGVTGRATLTASHPQGAAPVQVPRSSLTHIDGQPHVFIHPDAPAPLPVTVEGYLDDDVILSAHGLTVGARVASQGVFLLKSVTLLSDAQD
jgi:multidrug efflux pump subunit AcrA (membrane-fusion protein)